MCGAHTAGATTRWLFQNCSNRVGYFHIALHDPAALRLVSKLMVNKMQFYALNQFYQLRNRSFVLKTSGRETVPQVVICVPES